MIDVVLNQIKINIEKFTKIPSQYTISKGQQNGFELLIGEVLKQMKSGSLPSPTKFDYKLHYGSHFPDLDIYIQNKIYGVEIKSRQKLEWVTNGNSVLESISSPGYDEIYLLFGAYEKKDKRYQVDFKPYWQVTDDIKVTHSPRFYINMNTSSSVFSHKNEYDDLRNSNEEAKILFLQNYLKRKTKTSKWYTPSQGDEIMPINFNNLELKIKEKIICEIFILFPYDLFQFKSNGTPRSDYNNAVEYMISTYYYYTPSMRDSFSAGGRVNMNGVSYPRTIWNFYNHKNKINDILMNPNNDFVSLAVSIWEKKFEVNTSDTFLNMYYSVLRQIQCTNKVHLKDINLMQLLK